MPAPDPLPTVSLHAKTAPGTILRRCVLLGILDSRFVSVYYFRSFEDGRVSSCGAAVNKARET